MGARAPAIVETIAPHPRIPLMQPSTAGALARSGSLLAALFAAACGRDPAPPAAAAVSGAKREAAVPLPEGTVLPASAGAMRPAAVVELYTSEGCSSCPSADAVVNALEKASRADKKRVYVLAFHVDYWDDIGWPDPFSNAAYTARQRERSRREGKRGVYTPEAVVQGKDGFIGSDEGKMRASVARALSAAPSVTIESLSVDVATKTASWAIASLPAGARIHLAVTEGGLVVNVRAGENAGRKLAHEGVVRSFQSTKEPRGKLALGAMPNNGSVILFVEGEDGAVLGAQAVDLEATVVSSR